SVSCTCISTYAAQPFWLSKPETRSSLNQNSPFSLLCSCLSLWGLYAFLMPIPISPTLSSEGFPLIAISAPAGACFSRSLRTYRCIKLSLSWFRSCFSLLNSCNNRFMVFFLIQPHFISLPFSLRGG